MLSMKMASCAVRSPLHAKARLIDLASAPRGMQNDAASMKALGLMAGTGPFFYL
jgi:hypothetical protein